MGWLELELSSYFMFFWFLKMNQARTPCHRSVCSRQGVPPAARLLPQEDLPVGTPVPLSGNGTALTSFKDVSQSVFESDLGIRMQME